MDLHTEDHVRPIALDILAALQIAHGKNIVHRDIRPSNIILTSEKR